MTELEPAPVAPAAEPAAAPATPAVPALPTVDGYVIDPSHVLGKGYFCHVYMATHSSGSGARAAARVTPVPCVGGCDPYGRRQSCVDELTIMRRMAGHPHVAQLVGSLIEEARIISLVEYTPHGDLLEWFHHMKQGRPRAQRRAQPGLTEPQVRRLFRHLLSALTFAHTLDIAHRDVKLENVLLYADTSVEPSVTGRVALRAVLCDWNLATQQPHNLTLASGSPLYAAPELISGARFREGMPCDVWALGVVTYTLFNGRQPFLPPVDMRTDNPHYDTVLRQNIAHAQLEFPRGISDDARHLLAGMLDRDPVRRATVGKLAGDYAWVSECAVMPIYARD